ncbi:MAG: sensor histidine kinase N-terminal domain-containing protein [Burkholderiales bacterium]|nr:sensor histidine kinase N-terminal domain-containing protein [Burkholderiales bacterium]
MKQQPSLRRGLLFRLVGLMLTFSLLASAVAYRLSLQFSDDAYDQWLLDSARSVGQLIQVRNQRIEIDLPPSTLKAVIWDAYDQIYFRVDSNGTLLAGQTNLHVGYPLSNNEVYFFDLYVDGQPTRAVQINRSDVLPGHQVTITMAETLHKRKRLANKMLWTVMAISLALSLLTILFARDAVTRGLRPLLTLADKIRTRPSDDLTKLPDAGIAQELGVFTAAINDLLGKLGQALQSQRRFVTDAAHQLRTPLAALKMELEHALREQDPARHREALTQLRAGIDRMARLSNQLLTLARAEPGSLANTQFQKLDLFALVYRASQAMVPRALTQGADLGFESEPGAPLWVRGDALLLEELTHNLLDNALKYAGPTPRIDIHVNRDQNSGIIRIEDNGPGVPDDELPRIGERFHRPPGSPAGGSGLGLAIVQEIVQAHGGSMAIAQLQPHGLRVTVTLPLVE